MEFPKRLAALRKERRQTQKTLAEQVGVHIIQIQRYENGSIQPTLDVIRRLAIALSVSADLLVFNDAATARFEDRELLRQFQEVEHLPDEDGTMTTLTIDLPDNLAEEAKQAGLLTPNAIETILRETLRGRAIKGLFTAADKLAAVNIPPMTMGEIQKEVNAVRTQRKQRASGT